MAARRGRTTAPDSRMKSGSPSQARSSRYPHEQAGRARELFSRLEKLRFHCTVIVGYYDIVGERQKCHNKEFVTILQHFTVLLDQKLHVKIVAISDWSQYPILTVITQDTFYDTSNFRTASTA